MNNDIRTKPYDLLVDLVEAKDKGELAPGLMTSSQLNNLSFELLLFYLMFILAYLNNTEIKKINRMLFQITNYLHSINQHSYNINRIKLSCQAYNSYKNIDTFKSLYKSINKIPGSIKIHKYFIDFIVFLNNFIITNNRLTSSIRTSAKTKDIKMKIRELFSIIVNYTYQSHKGTHIEIDEEILDIIKYKLFTLIKIFDKYKLDSPLQCLEETKCTDLISLEKLRPHLSYFDDILRLI